MEVTIPMSLPDAQLVINSLLQWGQASQSGPSQRLPGPEGVAAAIGGTALIIKLQGHGQELLTHTKQIIINMYLHLTLLPRI
jgi:hypothetical protein